MLWKQGVKHEIRSILRHRIVSFNIRGAILSFLYFYDDFSQRSTKVKSKPFYVLTPFPNTFLRNLRAAPTWHDGDDIGVIIWYRISVDHVWTPAFHSIDPTSSCMMCLIIDRSESKFIVVPMNSDCSQSVFIAIMCDHWSCESYESSLAMITDHRCLEFIAIMYD